MSTTASMLLRAASELVGGDEILARCLGIPQTLLAKYMADASQLPDALLLRTVDIVLERRQPVPPASGSPGAAGSLGGE